MHPTKLVDPLRKDTVVPGQGKHARLSHEGWYDRLSHGWHGWSPLGENDPGLHGAEEQIVAQLATIEGAGHDVGMVSLYIVVQFPWIPANPSGSEIHNNEIRHWGPGGDWI